MNLEISQIVSKEQLGGFLRGNVRYSDLISIYQSISKEKINLISSHNASFVDLLSESIQKEWSFFQPNDAKPEELLVSIEKALLDKLTVGLMAVDEIRVKDVASQLLFTDSNFLSAKYLENFANRHSNALILKESSSGLFLRKIDGENIISSPPRKTSTPSEPKKQIKIISSTQDFSRIQEQLRHLYKYRPEVIKALELGATWKSVLNAYNFWHKFVANGKLTAFNDWLMEMAQAKSSFTFEAYNTGVRGLFLEKIVQYVGNAKRSIQQIFDHLNLDKPKFVEVKFVQDIIEWNPDQLTTYTTKGSLSQRFVILSTSLGIPQEEFDEFSLPRNLNNKVQPLLTLRATFTSVLGAARNVLIDGGAKQKISRHGCFLRYLIELAAFRKQKLSIPDYEQLLQNMVKTNMLKILKAAPRPMRHEEIIEKISTLECLLDRKFITDIVNNCSLDFAFDEYGNIVLRETISHEMDPHKHLETMDILCIFDELLSYGEILRTYRSLPHVAKCILANTSMSFFEWLVTLAKKRCVVNYAAIESHLHKEVRKQVFQLHSEQKCQMTISHIHQEICMGEPMLLSPNFLNWCLNCPESPFQVHQSWVYLKVPEIATAPTQDRKQHPSGNQSYFTSIMTQVFSKIHSAEKISIVIDLIKNIPQRIASIALLSSGYWYDFLENSIRERGDRMRMVSLVAEGAVEYLRHRIMRIRDLITLLSGGLPNFISVDVLEDILGQKRDFFAISKSENRDAMVGVVRGVYDNDIFFYDDQEEIFMKKVLSCFPQSGASTISSFANIIQTEVQKELPQEQNFTLSGDFLKCYFLLFPMLFYVQNTNVVLTCTALDRKKAESGVEPTCSNDLEQSITPLKLKKKKRRSRRHSRSGRHKKRRKSDIVENDDDIPFLESEHDTCNNEDTFDGDVSNDPNSVGNQTLVECRGNIMDGDVQDESDVDSNEKVINDLPQQLILDFALSILFRYNSSVKPEIMIEELVSSVLAAVEARQVEESPTMKKLFINKVFGLLKSDTENFVLVCDEEELNTFDQVKLIKGINRDDPSSGKPCNIPSTHAPLREEFFLSPGKNDAQQREVSDTSNTETSPVTIIEKEKEYEEPNQAHSLENNDVIPFVACDIPDASTDGFEGTKQDDEKKEQGKTEHTSTSTAVPEHLEDRVDPLRIPTDTVPVHVVENSDPCHLIKHITHGTREENIDHFCSQFMEINSGGCSSELLLQRAYCHFKGERITRSRLAFEAFIYDYLLKNSKTYILSGVQSQYGVTWIKYCRWSSPIYNPSNDENLAFLLHLPDVATNCVAYLKECEGTKADLNDICTKMDSNFRCKLDDYPEAEIYPVVRCLILVMLIRNLRLFCFSVDSPSVYLRGDHSPKKVRNSLIHKRYHKDIENILLNRTLTEAILYMADILLKRGPSTPGSLKKIWQARAPPKLCNVFGTGISFTLSIRKYSFLFSTSSNGLLTIHKDVLDYIKFRHDSSSSSQV